jgi:hypothetical protein
MLTHLTVVNTVCEVSVLLVYSVYLSNQQKHIAREAAMFEAWGRALGRANWWAPRPLRRLYARYGIKEESPQPLPVPAGT